MTLSRVHRLLSEVRFRDWEFRTGEMGDGFMVQVAFMSPCTDTGTMQLQTGRKWYVSSHAIDEEVVQTALKAVLTALEHEAREEFLYMGRSIFGPHLSLGTLFMAAHPRLEAHREDKREQQPA